MRLTMNCTLTFPTWCRHLTSVVILEIFKIKSYSLVWKQWNCITCTQPPLSCMHSPGFVLLAEVCPCSKARNKICQIKLETIQIFSFLSPLCSDKMVTFNLHFTYAYLFFHTWKNPYNRFKLELLKCLMNFFVLS